MSRPTLETIAPDELVDEARDLALRRQQVPVGKAILLALLVLPLIGGIAFLQRTLTVETSTETLDEIRARAAAEQRRVALYFTDRDSIACVRMTNESWGDPAVAAVVDRSVLLWTVDPDQPGAAALRREYGVTETPAVVVLSAGGAVLLDPAGNEIRATGFVGPDELRKLLTTPTRRGAMRTASMAAEARLSASAGTRDAAGDD